VVELTQLFANEKAPRVTHYDDLETRSPDAREAALATDLPEAVARAIALPGYALDGIDASAVSTRRALSRLPVLRKSALLEAQAKSPPLGGFTPLPLTGFSHVFQSPGPIYEPGSRALDWWRIGRFLHALGVSQGDIVQNCFGYHLTPAGLMFESAAAAVCATVLPAGTGQTELQARAARDIGTNVYAGTPDYLKTILDKADELGFTTKFAKAAVSGGALFPSLRQSYADRGITCRQCYATADLGLIAYESEAMEGMIVDEGVIVEIVTPGTGAPVPDGEVGELVVTTLNPDSPLIRFATGDLSAVLPGQSPCGRTNVRITGWRGRADQTTKIKGMFVRPEQVADFVARHPEVARARVIADREGDADVMLVQVESDSAEAALYETSVADITKLRGRVEVVPPGTLPKDGIVIEDRRKYE
jgi:phenylacetate-CoA ligase